MYENQVKKARDSIFIEMCNEMGQGFDWSTLLSKSRRTITKEKLCDWVDTVSIFWICNAL